MLRLTLRPSRIERLLLGAVHAAALFALTTTSLSPWFTVPLAMGIVCSLGHHCHWHPWQKAADTGSRAPLRIDIGAAHCRLVYAGRTVSTTLPRVEFLSEWLLLLRFDVLQQVATADAGYHDGHGKVAGSIRKRLVSLVGTGPHIRVCLLPDSLAAEDDRVLRRYLHFYRASQM